jgi:PKD repeat protein
MKKTFLFFSLFAISLQISFAQIVARETARNVAKNMYYERANIGGQVNYSDITFSQDYMISHDQQPVYYVFNISGNRGFVIVSAEERAVPVLHYSFEGSYDPANLPENFVYCMNNYERQIIGARENNVAKDKKITGMWTYYTASTVPLSKAAVAVAPLLGSLAWDQGCYYNAQCPTMSGGDCNKCPTGCVATAMAMIMKYHGYPAHGYSSHSYVHSTANGFDNNFGTLTANFGATTYNWAGMPNSVSSTNSAVATLMYHCGVSVNMNYDVYGSGAYLTNAASALTYYFTYNASYSYKDMFTAADWKAMLKNNLDSLRPVLYGGQDATFGGHAFVCDGYQGTNNDYFHFNFGWSGSSNGYEYVDAITPSGTPDNFSTNQEAVYNIYPKPATAPLVDFTANKTSLPPNDFVIFTNTSTNNPLDYTWSVTPSTGVTYIAGTSSTSVSAKMRFANTGYYTISLTGTNSAGTDTETKTNYIHVWIDDAGVEQADALKNISIFPNPSDGLITIQAGPVLTDEVSVKVYNIVGSEVSNTLYTKSLNNNGIILDLTACKKGLYFIKIITPKGTVTKKVELTK